MRTEDPDILKIKSEMSDLKFRCKSNFNGMWEFDWASTNGINNENYFDVMNWKYMIMMINNAIHDNKPKSKGKGKRRF